MPRRVSVLYFGGAREAAGKNEEELVLPDNVVTIADLAEHFAVVNPGLAGRLSSVRYAINEAFVDASATVRAGDIVAVIPPVSGG